MSFAEFYSLTVVFTLMRGRILLVDQGGTRDVRPLSRPSFFNFHAVFGKNIAK